MDIIKESKHNGVPAARRHDVRVAAHFLRHPHGPTGPRDEPGAVHAGHILHTVEKPVDNIGVRIPNRQAGAAWDEAESGRVFYEKPVRILAGIGRINRF